MLYISNNISPNMMRLDVVGDTSLQEFQRVAFEQIKPMCNQHKQNIRIPSLTEWGRRIVTEGLRLDIPPKECRHFTLTPDDDLLIVKYHGRPIDWNQNFDIGAFDYYHVRIIS